jgi:1-acyl-sn-glycerol-3-phosphate acyltransferase
VPSRAARLGRIGLHLAAGVFASAFIYPFAAAPLKRALKRRWSRKLLAILGITLRADCPRIAPGTLLVANHVSWLDVIALNARCPATFVAKSEVSGWPLIGWLLARNDTVFLKRRISRDLLRVNAEIGARLAKGEVVAFFPEGTTSDGAGVLPFRAALFEPAVRGSHPVQPLLLSYSRADGRRCVEAAFLNQQSLWESILAIASVPAFEVRLQAAAPLCTAGLSRREAASAAQAGIQERLGGGSSLPERQKPAETPAGLQGSASAAGVAPSSAAPIWARRAVVSRA